MRSFFKVSRIGKDHPDYDLVVKSSPLMHLAMIANHETGVCPTTINNLSTACGLSRQQVRTLIDKYEESGLVIKKTQNSINVGGKHPISRSELKIDFSHPLWEEFGINKVEAYDKPDRGYPDEFNEDWDLYCGNDSERCGQKSSAWGKWKGACEIYGRDKVMAGTKAYIAECESMDKWKKNASTWWWSRKGKPFFMEDKYQHEWNPHIALSLLMDSPVLGNILNGGVRIHISVDPYMCETLLLMKGSNRSLSDIYDRIGERRFKDLFIEKYSDCLSNESFKGRDVIYAKCDQEIKWS